MAKEAKVSETKEAKEASIQPTISSDNSHGLVAFIFGMFSILLAPGLDIFIFYGPVVSIILGMLGIIFAIKQRKVNNNKWAKTGLWLSILGIVISIGIILTLVKFITSAILPKLSELQQQIMAAAGK